MAKARKKKAAKKKASKKAGRFGPLRGAGSPITIGPGSVQIQFQDENKYPNHPWPGSHNAGASAQIRCLMITDSTGKPGDLSSLLPINGECQLTIYTKSGRPEEVITIQGKPLGITFDEGIYKPVLGKPNVYYSTDASMSRIEFSYPGNMVTFSDPTVDRYTITVDYDTC